MFVDGEGNGMGGGKRAVLFSEFVSLKFLALSKNHSVCYLRPPDKSV